MFKYNSPTFNEIYEDYDTFSKDLKLYGYDFTNFDESKMKLLFILLLTKYGDNEIVSYENLPRWKMRLQLIIFTYFNEWKNKLDIQNEIVNLKEDDLKRSNIKIQNIAENPATSPDDNTINELSYINQQVVNATKRDKLSILLIKYQALMSNANNEFLSKFKVLFSRFPNGDKPIWYYKGAK